MKFENVKMYMTVQVKENIEKSIEAFGASNNGFKELSSNKIGIVKEICKYDNSIRVQFQAYGNPSHYYVPEDLRIVDKENCMKNYRNTKYIGTVIDSSEYTTKKTCIADFIATADFWKWAGENANIVRMKHDWPEYYRLEKARSDCAFCNYLDCQTCYLKDGLGDCCVSGSSYYTWNGLTDIDPKDRSPSNIQEIRLTSFLIELQTRRFIEYLRKNLPKG